MLASSHGYFPVVNFEPSTLIVIAVIIVTFLGVAYGLKTRKGSGINEHPGTDSDDPAREPEGPSEEERPDVTVLDQRGKT